MKKCNENCYELISEIWAYPNNAILFSQPFAIMNKYIDPTEYRVDESKRIALSIKKKTAQIKESPSISASGESYEVVITFQLSDVTKETLQTMEQLRYTNNHLIVNTFGDNLMLVRTCENAYHFEYKEQDGNLLCEMTIQNVCGVQRVL